MDFYEAQNFFKKLYPDRLVTFEFDDKCIRQIECIHTDGKLHKHNHVQYEKVKVTPQGVQSMYVPIKPHRENVSAVMLKKHIASRDVFIHPSEIELIKKMQSENDPDLAIKLKELENHTGMSGDEILKQCH